MVGVGMGGQEWDGEVDVDVEMAQWCQVERCWLCRKGIGKWLGILKHSPAEQIR